MAVDFARGIGEFWGNQSDFEVLVMREVIDRVVMVWPWWNQKMKSGVFSSEDWRREMRVRNVTAVVVIAA
ncbi:MAG TPA: hypothetical protein VHS13_01910, partial [Edaphobacter sp.]|nr:hypothetical protein [Edaphobacter sp.]